MKRWVTREIRRQLPAYRDRDGDVVYNAPYRATQADLNAFVFAADPSTLQTLIDGQLNRCVQAAALPGSQQGLHFACPDPWVVFIYAAFRSLASTDEVDRRRGFVSAFELSIWVPITKHQDVAGTMMSDPAWFLPLVYTAPTASVMTGREVYGYPKVPAYLELPPEGGPPIGVHLRDAVLPLVPKPRGAAADTRLFEVGGGTCPPRPGAEFDAQAVVLRYLANVPLIFLKQVGFLEGAKEQGSDERSALAGYSALLEARVPITRLEHVQELQALGQLQRDPAIAGVADALGLVESRPRLGIAVRGCTIDVQRGREIWVADRNAPYITPLRAPGNEPLRKPGAFDLVGRRSAAPGRAGASPPYSQSAIDIIDGVGEVYFGPTPPRAIAALLAQDFPAGLTSLPPEPDPDPERQFLLLMFVRAADHAAVRLYEFAVWVPVLHEGSPAWYVPYMFRSPGAAVIHAREWQGHPCQEAFIEFDDALDTPRKVSVQQPIARGPQGLEWVKDDAVVFQPTEQPAGCDGKWLERAGELLATDGRPQNVVALFQVRHVTDTSCACVQSIVRSTRGVSARVGNASLWRQVKLNTRLRLARLLDIDGTSGCVEGYRLTDLRIISTPSTLTWKS